MSGLFHSQGRGACMGLDKERISPVGPDDETVIICGYSGVVNAYDPLVVEIFFDIEQVNRV